jgi:hypothetical protein
LFQDEDEDEDEDEDLSDDEYLRIKSGVGRICNDEDDENDDG